MADKTEIQWTDRTFSPITGCTRTSPGCEHCYAERLVATRLRQQKRYQGLAMMCGAVGNQEAHWTNAIRLHEDLLLEPLKWQKPQKVFVCSMSDAFHKDVPDAFLDRMFAVFALSPHITFQMLTKRAERMRSYLSAPDICARIEAAAVAIAEGNCHGRWFAHAFNGRKFLPRWPLPNVWLGVSVESQKYADERVPLLAETPATIRFLSCEPLIGPVDLLQFLPIAAHKSFHTPTGRQVSKTYWTPQEAEAFMIPKPMIHWCIVGGESGPQARPCQLEWMRALVAQCKAGSVAPFVKQLGAAPLIAREEWADTPAPPLLREPKTKESEYVENHRGYGILHLKNSHGGDMSEWPDDLRIREFPESAMVVTAGKATKADLPDTEEAAPCR